MKIHHYISALWAAILVLVVSMTACSDHDFGGKPGNGSGSGNDGDAATMQIGINVVLPYMGSSRATYELGDTYENTVNLAGKDYRLLLFTSDTKTLVCNFDPMNVQYKLSNSLSYRVCTIYADVDEDITSHRELRLVMLANWGDYPDLKIGRTTIDDLAGYAAATGAVSTDAATTFAASGQLVAADGKYIPLFGVKECKNINWVSGTHTWLGDLWLLRSVAKIEVKSIDNLPPIESVELTRYNAQGTCAPRGVYSENAYVAALDQYKPANYVTLPGGKNDAQAKNYRLSTVDGDGKTFAVYVPEYRILSDYAKPQQPMADMPVLNVKFKGVDQIYQVEFKYYNDESASDNDANKGDYFDIRRNYIYRYNLRLTGSGLEWDVDVLPYSSVELNPNFGLLLSNVTLNKYVCKLYIDPNAETRSQDMLIAYDENNDKLTARTVSWRHSETITNHVCNLHTNPDGSCTVKPIPNTMGRDIVDAVIIDKNGFEVIAECIIEVTERHLGLEKTFLGLIPYDILPNYSAGSFRVNIVAERDDNSKLSWKLLDAKDMPLAADMADLVTVTAEGDGGHLDSGDLVSEKNITIHVQANGQSKMGDAHLWLYYEGPDPDHLDDPSKRRTYSTYCDIVVSNVSLTVYPTILNMTVGQQSSVTARTAPVFSDYIPALSFESLDTDVVTVDSNGLVTAVGQGTTRIKVSSPDDLLNWIEPEYVDVSVIPDDLILTRYDGSYAEHVELLSGEKIQLKAMSYGVDVSKIVTWDIVDDPFVTIENGVVTGTMAGTSTVRATYTVGGQTYSETCIVVVAAARKLVIEDFPKGVSVHASVPMRGYVFPDSIPYDSRNYSITWSSNKPNIIAFDDKNDKSLAVAKSPGNATITATTTYNGNDLTATADIDVLGHDQDLNPEFHLYILDATGNRVKEIHTEYAYYPGYETGQGGWNDATDVRDKFDKVEIPSGQTWTAVIDFSQPDLNVPTSAWSKSKRFSGYDDRISITPASDGKSCKIKALPVTTANTRYNEVNLSFEYNGQTYSRRFCVFHK